MVLAQKWQFFQFLFLGHTGQENVFNDILARKNAFLDYKHKKFKNLKNWNFFKPMALVKKCSFFQLFILSNGGQENVFYDILERKNAFLDYQDKKFKKSKNWHLPEGVNHGFGRKMVIFPTFFFGNAGQQNLFNDFLERKNAFLDYQNKKFKNWKYWHFFKGVNSWFWSKNDPFSNFFFLAMEARKMSFTIF